MSGINAIKSSLYIKTHLRQGMGISRVYHNVKNLSKLNAAVAGLDLLLALQAVRNSWTFNTFLITGLTLYFSKRAVDYHNMSIDLIEHYQPIVDRAKQIYKR